MLSKSFIENKLKEISAQKEQTAKAIERMQKEIERAVANLNALSGAEQAYREMLAACKAEEVEQNPDTEEVKPDE